MARKRTRATQTQEDAIAATRLAFGLLREEAPFNDRGFSVRTIRALMDYGMDSPERLLFTNLQELRRIPGVGKASLDEIRKYRNRFISQRRLAPEGVGPKEVPNATKKI